MTNYSKATHLTDQECARHFKVALLTVQRYRDKHPATAYRPAPLPKERPGIVQLVIPLADPSRASGVGSVPVMRVSLPAPPWGGTFERQGVRA